MLDAIKNFLGTTGVAKLIAEPGWWQYLVMYVIIGALFYLAIVKKFDNNNQKMMFLLIIFKYPYNERTRTLSLKEKKQVLSVSIPI